MSLTRNPECFREVGNLSFSEGFQTSRNDGLWRGELKRIGLFFNEFGKIADIRVGDLNRISGHIPDRLLHINKGSRKAQVSYDRYCIDFFKLFN
jgi:hypothetical protein